MKTVKISVIMTVYNAEKYLAEAIDSLLCQTFENWELICIDDGSIDNSLALLQKYKDKDDRIILRTQSNSGISKARNLALSISSGDYILTLDADDLISRNHLEVLYSKAIQTDADCVVPNMDQLLYNNETNLWYIKELYNYDSMHEIDAIKAFELTFPWQIHACNLWKGDMVRSIKYFTFNPHNSDEYSSRVFFLNSKKIVFAPGQYIYRLNEESVTKKISLKLFYIFDTNEKLEKLAMANNISQDFYKKIRIISFNEIISKQALLFKKGYQLTPEERINANTMLKKAYFNFMDGSSIEFEGFKGMIKYVLCLNGYNLFVFSCRIFAKFISC